MLSASTVSSDAFSSGTSASTPLSQYSIDSTPKATGNPLTELIETEKNYMKTLKIIDNQLAPLWPSSPNSDFSELLTYVHDILKANKRFCAKLERIAANPQTIKELGDVLMQWIDDMEVPYANFSRSFISNLNQRQDILSNPRIRQLLSDLSSNHSYEITLESLFNAPVQQLKYYKVLYGRLLDSAEPGRADHKLLVRANKRIDTVMLMAQKNMGKSLTSPRSHSKALPVVTPIQTGISEMRLDNSDSELAEFERKLDRSEVVDLFTGTPTSFTTRLATFGASVLLRDNFVLLPEDTHFAVPVRTHLILTNECLIISERVGNAYKLLFPPIAVKDVTVKSKMLDRELIGEYLLEFTVMEKKHLTIRADSKEIRNSWVGVDSRSPSSVTLAPRPLREVAKKHGGSDVITEGSNKVSADEEEDNKSKAGRKSVLREQDFFSYYTDKSGEISPLSSDESDAEDSFLGKFQSTLASSAPTLPPKDNNLGSNEKTLPAPPPPPKKEPAKPVYGDLLPPLPTMDHRLSPRSPSPSPSISTHGSDDSIAGPARPVSPRTIEISHVVAPVAMQAITQQNEYLTDPQPATTNGGQSAGARADASNKPLPRTSSSGRGTESPSNMPMPRGSSFPQQSSHQAQKALPQHPPSVQPPMHQQQQQQQWHAQAPPPPHHANAASLPPPRPLYAGSSRSPSPGLPPSPGYAHQDPMRQASSSYLNVSPQLRPHGSMEDLSSPPRSPTPRMINGQANGIRQVLYSNGQCEVFRWKAESWYAVEGQCLLQVRQTYSNRACVAIQLQNTGQLYLNAWILPNTEIAHASPTDVSLSVYMGASQKENYLVHFQSPADAAALYQVLQRTHQEAIRMQSNEQQGSLRGAPPFLTTDAALDDAEETRAEEQVPQTLRLVMQCKCKLFVQNEHSNWSSFGSVTMKISQQLPSKKMHIEMENGKGKLVSATVQSRNVERISSKRITFLLINERERTSMVYMVRIKEEETGHKIYEYLKTKNMENGW